MSKARQLADNGAATPNRNMVINGAMNVAQRGTSSTGLGASNGYFTLDRWKLEFDSTAGRLTMTQTADGPSGFLNCLKFACTTADTSIAAGEIFTLQQRFEGQNLQRIKKGTSDAEKLSVSFYVKGNASATYVCELRDQDNERHVAKTFAVTTSWNRIELVFPADTSGAFGDDNARSLDLNIWLHAGSTYTGGTLASTWASTTNGNRAAGISSFFDATSRTFFITGVQMEVGEPTPFEHEPYGVTQAKCYRYAQRHPSVDSGENYNQIANGFAGSATETFHFCRHYETMRAEPSLTNNGSFRVRYRATATDVTSATTLSDAGSNMDNTFLVGTVGSTQTTGEGALLEQSNDVDAHIILDAEL
tara:strand:+ start:19941 stop:21026 length:1086 start_codon:yes stop_codon:yes gene_type:complete